MSPGSISVGLAGSCLDKAILLFSEQAGMLLRERLAEPFAGVYIEMADVSFPNTSCYQVEANIRKGD